MEISLYRLEMCGSKHGERLGVTFKPNTPSAVTCEDIVVNIPPNQVIPIKSVLGSHPTYS